MPGRSQARLQDILGKSGKLLRTSRNYYEYVSDFDEAPRLTTAYNILYFTFHSIHFIISPSGSSKHFFGCIAGYAVILAQGASLETQPRWQAAVVVWVLAPPGAPQHMCLVSRVTNANFPATRKWFATNTKFVAGRLKEINWIFDFLHATGVIPKQARSRAKSSETFDRLFVVHLAKLHGCEFPASFIAGIPLLRWGYWRSLGPKEIIGTNYILSKVKNTSEKHKSTLLLVTVRSMFWITMLTLYCCR